MRNQIVILAAGKGTRMGQAETPKVLIMLKNKPIILYLLEQVEKINQLVKPVIVVGYKFRHVQDVLGDGFLYAYQDRQMGTGHAVMCARPRVTGDNILVLYGDMPFVKAESLKKLMQLHYTEKSVVSMFTTVVESFEAFPSFRAFGRIVRNTEGAIARIVEYKDAKLNEQQICEVNPGIYMFNTAWLWNHIHLIQNNNTQGEYYLTDIIELAIKAGRRIESLVINPYEAMGINSPEELLAAEKIIK